MIYYEAKHWKILFWVGILGSGITLRLSTISFFASRMILEGASPKTNMTMEK